MIRDGKIVIWATVLESYRVILKHPLAFLRICWLPLIILFLLNLIFGTFGPGAASAEPAVVLAEVGRVLVNILAQTTVAAVVLVAWHRVVMLGPEGHSGLLAVALGLREMRYLLAWLLLSVLFLVLIILCFAVIVAIGFATLLGLKVGLTLLNASHLLYLGGTDHFFILQLASLAPAFLLATYVASRLSLILPAMATDRQRSVRRAWTLSAGNGWRLTVASLFVMLPVECVSVSSAYAAHSATGTLAYYPFALAASLSLLLLIVATGTVLSLFSLELERGKDAVQDATAFDAGPAVAAIR